MIPLSSSRLAFLATTVAAAFALPGCFEEVETLGAEADLNFRGQGNGAHSESAECGDRIEVSGSGTIEDGVLELRLSDGEGTQIFSQEFSESFTLSKRAFTGHAGTWKIEATRGGNDLAGDEFNGDYSITLNC